MPTQSWSSALMLASSFVVATAWEFNRVRLSPKPAETSPGFRLAGRLTEVEAVPIPAPIARLDVRVDSFVRKGQVVGVAETEGSAASAPGWASGGSGEEAESGLAAARQRLRAVEGEVATARGTADGLLCRLPAAEQAAIEAGHDKEASDWRYRMGVEPAVTHDLVLSKSRSAVEQEEALESESIEQATGLDEVEMERREAEAELREAARSRRMQEEEGRELIRLPRFMRVTSPADGYLVIRDERAGAYAVSPTLDRRVATQVTLADLAQLQTGQAAVVLLDRQPGGALRAVVEWIGPARASAAGDAEFPVTLLLRGGQWIGTAGDRATIILGAAGQ